MKNADVKKLQQFTVLHNAGTKKHRKCSRKTSEKKKPVKPSRSSIPFTMMGKRAFDNVMKGSLFRFLNEMMYTSSSEESLKLFTTDPQSFNAYHTGFQQQLTQWPQDPQLWIVDYLRTKEGNGKKLRIADLGCGDARLAKSLKMHKVYSYDLVAVNELVTACDMAHTPLKNARIDYVVFCLSLMGTNCRDFIFEANRILKINGELLIVDVASRFTEKFPSFLKRLKRFGFATEFFETTKDTYFVRARLKKVEDISHKLPSNQPELHINPCVYKKR